MKKDIKQLTEQFSGRKTILLPESTNSDCYAVYSKEEYKKNVSKNLIIDGKAYKHRLYYYKKLNNKSKNILTFIILNPGTTNHLKEDTTVKNCIKIANKKYGAIEIFSIFTLRTTIKINAVLENAILNITRTDLSKNDIVLAYGDKLKYTSNISRENLTKINKVRDIKVNELLNFIFNQPNRKGKIYTVGLTKSKNPKTLTHIKNTKLIEVKLSDLNY